MVENWMQVVVVWIVAMLVILNILHYFGNEK